MSESEVIPAPTPINRRGRRLRRLLMTVGAIALVVAILFRGPLFFGNFDVVDPGRAYRSAQPGGRLDNWLQTYNVATLINLRGGSDNDDWYQAEVRTAREREVDYFDWPMNAQQRPRRKDLLTLIDIFQRARYPILIHCKAGADRTGLASAVYQMVANDVGPKQALRQFSLAYAHFAMFGTEKLHQPLEEYADWLDDRGIEHSAERFRSWVEKEYQAPDPPEHFQPLPTGSRWDRKAG